MVTPASPATALASKFYLFPEVPQKEHLLEYEHLSFVNRFGSLRIQQLQLILVFFLSSSNIRKSYLISSLFAALAFTTSKTHWISANYFSPYFPS